jgi:hypothetical protein
MMGGYAPDQRWWWSGKGFVPENRSGAPSPAAAGTQVQCRSCASH